MLFFVHVEFTKQESMIRGFLNHVIIQEEILSSSICGFQRHFVCVGWQKCRQHRSYMGGFFFFKQPERNIKMYITCTLFPLPRPIQMTTCNCTGGWEMQFKLYQQEGKRTGEQSVNFWQCLSQNIILHMQIYSVLTFQGWLIQYEFNYINIF